jgi:hypothetical protein
MLESVRNTAAALAFVATTTLLVPASSVAAEPLAPPAVSSTIPTDIPALSSINTDQHPDTTTTLIGDSSGENESGIKWGPSLLLLSAVISAGAVAKGYQYKGNEGD